MFLACRLFQNKIHLGRHFSANLDPFCFSTSSKNLTKIDPRMYHFCDWFLNRLFNHLDSIWKAKSTPDGPKRAPRRPQEPFKTGPTGFKKTERNRSFSSMAGKSLQDPRKSHPREIFGRFCSVFDRVLDRIIFLLSLSIFLLSSGGDCPMQGVGGGVNALPRGLKAELVEKRGLKTDTPP